MYFHSAVSALRRREASPRGVALRKAVAARDKRRRSPLRARGTKTGGRGALGRSQRGRRRSPMRSPRERVPVHPEAASTMKDLITDLRSGIDEETTRRRTGEKTVDMLRRSRVDADLTAEEEELDEEERLHLLSRTTAASISRSIDRHIPLTMTPVVTRRWVWMCNV
jgi:hypothetical protein